MLRLVSRTMLLSVRMVVLLFRPLAVTVVQASVSNCQDDVAVVQVTVIIGQDAVALFRLC
jgi:hypothetical protein